MITHKHTHTQKLVPFIDSETLTMKAMGSIPGTYYNTTLNVSLVGSANSMVCAFILVNPLVPKDSFPLITSIYV